MDLTRDRGNNCMKPSENTPMIISSDDGVGRTQFLANLIHSYRTTYNMVTEIFRIII